MKPQKAEWVHIGSEGKRALPVVAMTTRQGLHVDLVFTSLASMDEMINTLRGISVSIKRRRAEKRPVRK